MVQGCAGTNNNDSTILLKEPALAPGLVVEVVLVDEVDGQCRVVHVRALVVGLPQRLEGVRQRLQPADQLVRTEVLGNLAIKLIRFNVRLIRLTPIANLVDPADFV
jgi:hypothetical protein